MSKIRKNGKGAGRAAVLVRVEADTVKLLDDAAGEFGQSRNGFVAYWLGILADVHQYGSLLELAAELQQCKRDGESPYDALKMKQLSELRGAR
jgi:hypothetical protein